MLMIELMEIETEVREWSRKSIQITIAGNTDTIKGLQEAN